MACTDAVLGCDDIHLRQLSADDDDDDDDASAADVSQVMCQLTIQSVIQRTAVSRCPLWITMSSRVSHCLYVCICELMNWRRSYQKVTSPFCKLQIWACFAMSHVDTKFEQG